MDKVAFEINPLDINLAKLQFELLKLAEGSAVGEFSQVFESKDPTIKFLKIDVKCKLGQNVNLTAEFYSKIGEKKELVLFSGSNEQFLEYLNSKEFFNICKTTALSF